MLDAIWKYALINALKHGGGASVKAVVAKVVSEKPESKENIKELIKRVEEIVKEVNSLRLDEIKRKIDELNIEMEEKKGGKGLPDLPSVIPGKVVMRLAPFPSGPLHIGNARMVILNDEYVKRYKGKLILFFDDTIGSEDKPVDPDAYRLIKEGLDWLGVKYHEVYYKSDRLKIYYKYGEEMIEKGLAYVCTCSPEEIRKNRRLGVACGCRDRAVQENLELWRDMLAGKIKEGKAVVRIKTDMEHPNPAFRDRVLFRISEREHPRVGKKYRVWPMLEFSWAIDDHLLGVTHILRGKELRIEDMMEEFIWEQFGWPKAKFIHYGMLRLEGVKLSKSENRRLIKSGMLKGWDDPRTWSLQSLKKRGIQAESIRKFILNLGLSESDITLPVEILYAENRKIVDPIANRYFAVIDPVKISVDIDVKQKEMKYHPDFPDRGTRRIPLNPNAIYIERNDFEKYKGKKVGMINLFTVKLDEKTEFVSNKIPYNLPKVHWVSEPNVRIKIIMPDGREVDALGDPGIKQLEEGSLVQFYRVGFCRLDDKDGLIFYFAHK